MEVRKFSCPHCGASINIEGDKKTFFCTYCGGQVIVDDGTRKTIHEETINYNVNSDVKKERINTINDIAAVQTAKNEGFLNKYKFLFIIATTVVLVILLVVSIISGIVRSKHSDVYKPEISDTVIVNSHTTADFVEVVMGKIEEKSMIIVAEQEVSALIDIEKAGLFDWKIFKKSQQIKDYGVIQYTVDLSDIYESDIVYDQGTNTVTVYVPMAEIHEVFLKPEKREVGDPKNGFFAWGDIKLNAEESAALEAESIEKLRSVAEETIDDSVIEKATEKALKELLSKCISNVDSSTRLKIKVEK